MSSLRWMLVLASACAAGVRADDKTDEAKKLAGTWVVKSATRDGKPVDDMKDGRIVIAGEKLTIKPKDGKDQEFTFKVDPTRKPKTMDWAFVVNVPNASPGLMIYEVDGDSLKLAIGPPDKRPSEFTDKGQALVSLVRKK